MAAPDHEADGPHGPESDDVAAAELALGLIDDAERAAALARMAGDPAFAMRVAWWSERFAALFAAVPGVVPPPALIDRIEASLDGGRGANDNGRDRDRDRGWRRAAIGAGLAACLLLAVTVLLLLRPAPEPVRVPVPTRVAASAPLLAALAPAAGKGAAIAAAYDRDAGVVRIGGAVAVPAGRSAELWAIRGSGAPRSLGVLPDGAGRIVVPAGLRGEMAAETVLAITIEPAGGSPNGLPTGPVVASGKLAG